MLYDIARADVWVGELENRPGGLAEKLEILSQAEANLEFIVVRRDHESSDTAVMFVSPLRGAAAAQAGLTKATTMCTLRIEGPHQKGLAARISREIANAGLNMRGFSGASIGERSVINIAFETEEEVDQATHVLMELLVNR